MALGVSDSVLVWFGLLETKKSPVTTVLPTNLVYSVASPPQFPDPRLYLLAGGQAKDVEMCASETLPYPSGPLCSLQPVSPTNPLSVTEGGLRLPCGRSLVKRMVIEPCTGRADQHFPHLDVPNISRDQASSWSLSPFKVG